MPPHTSKQIVKFLSIVPLLLWRILCLSSRVSTPTMAIYEDYRRFAYNFALMTPFYKNAYRNAIYEMMPT